MAFSIMAEGLCAAQLSASIEAGPVVAGCERGEDGQTSTFGELDVATVSAMDRPSLRNGEVSQRLQRFFCASKMRRRMAHVRALVLLKAAERKGMW
ncbi:hypothetical protein AL043_04070 [Pseudomonas amygdali pv. aesculi]|nr:hypothetical protein AL041_22950 [Pseudomonas amygdali pv. aesculi]KWT19434.1 hypothetical protein AL043_04070 [Pseudomonas amygdali pv. aesculi]KWT20316.1 hypothetical protein AL042_25880 [Pseudomonas amygdali pv. aesculi]KWT32240.1 hypothetical protein AL044_09815 [Pseudomonas amygdali pv. aesculi]KWT42026.1 hypothetical protein AL045_00070 [Pseudomonas amygdali pv. aesculi]